MPRTVFELVVKGKDDLAELNRVLRAYNKIIEQTANASKGLNTSLGTSSTIVRTHVNELKKASAATKEVETSTHNWIKAMLAYRVVSMGFHAVVASITAAKNAMLDLEVQTARTMRMLPGADPRQIRAGIGLGVAKYGVSIQQAGEVSYQFSPFVPKQADMIKAVDTALKLIVGTESDTRETTRLLISTWNNFNGELDKTISQGEQIHRIGEMFATVFGRAQTEVDELTQSFKYVVPASTAAGVSLSQTLAILSALDVGGMRARQAGTGTSKLFGKFTEGVPGGYDPNLGGKGVGGFVSGKTNFYMPKFYDKQTGGFDAIRTFDNMNRVLSEMLQKGPQARKEVETFVRSIASEEQAFRALFTIINTTSRAQNFFADSMKEIEKGSKGIGDNLERIAKTMTETTATQFAKAWGGALIAMSESALRFSKAIGFGGWLKDVADAGQRDTEFFNYKAIQDKRARTSTSTGKALTAKELLDSIATSADIGFITQAAYNSVDNRLSYGLPIKGVINRKIGFSDEELKILGPLWKKIETRIRASGITDATFAPGEGGEGWTLRATEIIQNIIRGVGQENLDKSPLIGGGVDIAYPGGHGLSIKPFIPPKGIGGQGISDAERKRLAGEARRKAEAERLRLERLHRAEEEAAQKAAQNAEFLFDKAKRDFGENSFQAEAAARVAQNLWIKHGEIKAKYGAKSGDIGDVGRYKENLIGPYAAYDKRNQEPIIDKRLEVRGGGFLRDYEEDIRGTGEMDFQNTLRRLGYRYTPVSGDEYGNIRGEKSVTNQQIESTKKRLEALNVLKEGGIDVAQEINTVTASLEDLENRLKELNAAMGKFVTDKSVEDVSAWLKRRFEIISKGEQGDLTPEEKLSQMQWGNIARAMAYNKAMQAGTAFSPEKQKEAQETIQDSVEATKTLAKTIDLDRRERAQRRFQQMHDEISGQISGDFIAAYHGRRRQGDLLKNLGDTMVDTGIEAITKKYTDPLVNTLTSNVLAIQYNIEALNANTTALLNPGTGGGSDIVTGTVTGKADPYGFNKLNKMSGLQGGLMAYSMFRQGQQQGVTLGGIIGSAAAGYSVGGPIGAGIGAAVNLIGGLFGGKKDNRNKEAERNPAFYNSPSDMIYDAYRYRVTGELPGNYKQLITGYRKEGPVVNVYLDNVEIKTRQVVSEMAGTNNAAQTSVYFDAARPIG